MQSIIMQQTAGFLKPWCVVIGRVAFIAVLGNSCTK